MDKVRETALATYQKVVSGHETTDSVGVGSALWFLCKMMVDSKPNEEDESPPKISHIAPEQLLMIEQILRTLYKMEGVETTHRVMERLWRPNQKKKGKKKKKKKLSAAEKRKLKAEKARKKMMAKMQKKKGKFAEQNSENIKKDEMQEQMEEKEQKEAHGVGVKYQCIVCRSRERQDEMAMMAFGTKCGIVV